MFDFSISYTHHTFCKINFSFSYKYHVAGVHDSFWTHACDVDEMNKILREKFVELYEAPILENVSTCAEIMHHVSTHYLHLAACVEVHF